MADLPPVADFVVAQIPLQDLLEEVGSSDSESDSTGSGSDSRERSKRKQKYLEAKKLRRERLGKRLSYLLRYGAEKEGLTVLEGGYVELLGLLRVPLMKRYRPEEVLAEIDGSKSHRGWSRFEKKYEHGTIYVRALYMRQIERNPNHDGSNIPRLLEMCLTCVCDNIKDYDLENFPDEFLLNTMIHRLKRKKRLNNKALESILGPTIEHLDLTGVYLTEASIKLIGRYCPRLRVLNLHGCGYVMTDHFMEMLLKKIRDLESLNISGCHHLTDRTLRAFIKNLPKLQHINAAHCPNFTQEGILHLASCSPNLEHLDIFDTQCLSTQGKETLVEIAREKGLTLVVRGLEDPSVTGKHGAQPVLHIWKNAHT